MAADRVAQRRTGADQILALDLARRHRLSTPGRTRQTTLADRARKSSSKRLGSGISKAADGEAFIITPRCASPPTDSWSPRGRRFPPQALVPPGRSRHLPFPTVTDPEAPPLRTQRHVPNSIATMRQRLIVALAKTLPRCPCCAAPMQRNLRRNL